MYSEFLNLTTMSLATSNPAGEPHAAAVYFASHESPRLELFFFSSANSRHARDLALNPQAAVAIYPQVFDWQEICGLQLRGRVERVPAGTPWEQAWITYQEKFPFTKNLREIIDRNTLYVFNPSWMRLIDNRVYFGYIQEWQF